MSGDYAAAGPAGRKALLVGSFPAPDARQAMEFGLDALGDRLRALPDGETGDRFHWIIGAVEKLRHHPDLELRKDGDWSAYDKVPVFKERQGHKLRSETLNFGHVAAFDESWPIFEELRRKAGREDLAFQQGVPGDLDMAMFVFGPRCLYKRRPFTEATLEEIRQVYERGGRDVVFQIEVPVEQVFVAKMPGPLQPLMARFMARGIANLARRSPKDARFGIHLCVGDMNHKSLVRMNDARPIVQLANAIAAQWPADASPLEYIHVPFSAAGVAPPSDATWYGALENLNLPAHVRLVAGFAHADQTLEEQRRIRDQIERLARRRVDVSTTCGLGRCSPEDAAAAIKRIVELTAD